MLPSNQSLPAPSRVIAKTRNRVSNNPQSIRSAATHLAMLSTLFSTHLTALDARRITLSNESSPETGATLTGVLCARTGVGCVSSSFRNIPHAPAMINTTAIDAIDRPATINIALMPDKMSRGGGEVFFETLNGEGFSDMLMPLCGGSISVLSQKHECSSHPRRGAECFCFQNFDKLGRFCDGFNHRARLELESSIGWYQETRRTPSLVSNRFDTRPLGRASRSRTDRAEFRSLARRTCLPRLACLASTPNLSSPSV